MEPRKLAGLCRELAENKKAENVVVMDLRKLSTVTDFFVIASGTSEPHLRAIETELLDGLRKDHDLKPVHTEGSAQSNWIVADFFDVIVHILSADVRAHYDLEGLWADAPRVKPPAPRKRSEPAETNGTTENAPKPPKPAKTAKAAKTAKSPKAPKAVPAE